MAKWNEYTTKSAVEDTDELMIADATANVNKRTPLSILWNWIVGKLASAVISQLETNSKSVVGALNELNSKSLQLVSVSERVTTGKDFSYTGVKIEIPPQATAILQFEAVYGQRKPVSIGVSKSDTSFADGYLVTTCNYPQKCIFMHPAQEKATTYYAWASYSATSDNPVKIIGLFSQ